jgi:hypothetical protein
MPRKKSAPRIIKSNHKAIQLYHQSLNEYRGVGAIHQERVKAEFNLTLGSKGVNILDPCTGTGNFIVNLINRIPKKDLPRVYKEQLFANEAMLLPYYIAAVNIEHAYWERTGQYEAFASCSFRPAIFLWRNPMFTSDLFFCILSC